MVDNHLFHGNTLGIGPETVTWPRTLAMSDRALCRITLESGRQTEFVIAEASEVMAILGLAAGPSDLKARLGRILVGFTQERRPLTPSDFSCTGAMAALLKDALCPNLVQTIEGTPAFVHTGPFGNLAHGNSSILGRPDGAPVRGLCRHRGRLRKRIGRREVFQYQMPGVGTASRGCRCGSDVASAQAAWRRRDGQARRALAGGAHRAEPHGAGTRPAQPRATHCQRQDVRAQAS